MNFLLSIEMSAGEIHFQNEEKRHRYLCLSTIPLTQQREKTNVISNQCHTHRLNQRETVAFLSSAEEKGESRHLEIIVVNGKMKHSADDGVLQSNLLQAFQKNKIMQGKLSEKQRTYYVQLLKDMQDYSLKEKLNRELLYTWKKESYVRQLKKNLQEYERKRFGARDAYYQYQARNLDCIMAGEKGLVIPPNEEERRQNVEAKYRRFLAEHPLEKSDGKGENASGRFVQSAISTVEQTRREQEEADAQAVEKTWKSIHAQSAVGLERRKTRPLPAIQRSSTMDEIRRSNILAKTMAPPTVAIVSSVLVTTTPDLVHPPATTNDEGKSIVPTRLVVRRPTLPEGIEPVLITSETLQKQTRADLVAMRSVRRPRKNPIDLNMAFEARKRIYHINKRVYDYPFCQRKCGLQYVGNYDRVDPSDSDSDDDELLEMNELARKRYENRHQADRAFI